ncbi:MAG: TM0106 family RecB-like putative nuclease [Actinomycetia bacterium]|nr:TM0106 family RecB-like putative nuclease [Actinomycetes bacterium]
MDRVDGKLIVSPTDLVGYLACGHLSVLDLEALDGERRKPNRGDPELDVVRRRGLEHEAAYLISLSAAGLNVAEIAEPATDIDRLVGLRQREADTVSEMRAGADVVFQATFLDESADVFWRGHADFLRKVSAPSSLGCHSYEPEDTKLARHVKPSAILQLCHYAEQVERIQGLAPEGIHVVLGGQHRESVRLADVAAYYRAARSRFLTAVAEEQATYPLPVEHCAVCRWTEVCEQRREGDDHLCRVANLTREQARKLEAAGIGTLRALAASGDALVVPGISSATLSRLRQQARLQIGRGAGAPPPVELIFPIEADRGLTILPEPDAGDLFYDIEGDPYVGDHGIEYLHGIGWAEGDGFGFEALWAHTEAEERGAFEKLIDLIVERRRLFPKMHVYHYAPYETSALGKLMGRYGSREAELDDLLRGGVFVDLFRVVRQGLVIGSPSYSLKKLEPLYMEARSGEITDAGSSIVEYERWLQTGDQEILDDIEAYNRDDVESTWRLRDWLEDRREELIAAGHDVDRPASRAPDDGAETSSDFQTEEDLLAERLLQGRADPPTETDDEQIRADWLMAHLLRWHRREDKPEWWRFFDRILSCDEADLLADTEAISGLTLLGDPIPDKRSLIWRYKFDPDQEHKLRVGAQILDPATEREKYQTGEKHPGPGTLVGIDHAAGTLQLRRGANSTAPHPAALIPAGPIPTPEQRSSLRRVALALLDHGIDGAGPAEAARQLLAGRPPKVTGIRQGDPLRRSDEPAVDAAVRLGLSLDRSYLPIQGPPGSGKTFTAAKVITALVANGRTVGITANSHAVITNLLERVAEETAAQGLQLRAIQKVSTGDEGVDHPAVHVTKSNSDVEAGIAAGNVDVIAGTAWLFARDTMTEAVETLVIDEAGQLSLANVLAVAPAAANVILVGDPRQLAQPSKGTHPAGAGVSGLDHVLAGEATTPEHLGLFLDRSWRMHPGICGFISEQVYEGRLESQTHCAVQRIDDGPLVGGAGLRWLGVDHEANRTSSAEEGEALAQLFEALVGRGWIDNQERRTSLGIDDILVVAPYNAQVHLLAERLPVGARVGTVDKFQGQEAPVVLVSLTASSAEDVPRGMEFLYSRNRLNVAVSRAKALCVVAGSPALLAVQCRTVEQMRLANVLCRYVELAGDISNGGSAQVNVL